MKYDRMITNKESPVKRKLLLAIKYFFFQGHYGPDSGLGLPCRFLDDYNDMGYQRHDRPNSNHSDSASRDI
jgi:hypothetical protein